MSGSLPDVRPAPCKECPWRRTSAPGWLGPHDADAWVTMAHSDVPIACHLTHGVSLDDDEDWLDGMLQCAGSAIYRSNVAKLPRDPDIDRLPADRELVFANPMQFKEHHQL